MVVAVVVVGNVLVTTGTKGGLGLNVVLLINGGLVGGGGGGLVVVVVGLAVVVVVVVDVTTGLNTTSGRLGNSGMGLKVGTWGTGSTSL